MSIAHCENSVAVALPSILSKQQDYWRLRMIPFILKLIAKACALCVVLPLDIYDLCLLYTSDAADE